MTDQEKARDVNEAARRFAETLADSYRLVYGQATESAERQQQRAQEFSELLQGNLKEQAEAGRANVEQLTEQASRQREAGQQLARESVEAYTQFLNDAFSQYRAGTEQAVGTVQEGARTLTDTATGLVGTATGVVGSAAEAPVDAASSAAESAVFPIPGYDDMNVDEVSKHLNDLSTEELRLVRDYEERNKNRESLLTQMDRKIRAE
jgi:exonuclease VII large subunit